MTKATWTRAEWEQEEARQDREREEQKRAREDGERKAKAFLDKLGVAIAIGGCGCCSSPWVEMIIDGERIEFDHDEFTDEHDDGRAFRTSAFVKQTQSKAE